jgi:ABC-type molybdate transport system substrate-binding protein
MEKEIKKKQNFLIKNIILISDQILQNINNEKSIHIFGSTYIKILQYLSKLKNSQNKKFIKLLKNRISILKKFNTKQWINWAKKIQKDKSIL